MGKVRKLPLGKGEKRGGEGKKFGLWRVIERDQAGEGGVIS